MHSGRATIRLAIYPIGTIFALGVGILFNPSVNKFQPRIGYCL